MSRTRSGKVYRHTPREDPSLALADSPLLGPLLERLPDLSREEVLKKVVE